MPFNREKIVKKRSSLPFLKELDSYRCLLRFWDTLPKMLRNTKKGLTNVPITRIDNTLMVKTKGLCHFAKFLRNIWKECPLASLQV